MQMKYVKRELARQLRQEQTAAEEMVWKLLRNRKCMGLKFRRQHVIEGFVVDFYCHEANLAIEIDGGVHNKQKDYDEFRQREIEAEDISFVRLTNKEINKDKNVVYKKIREALLPSPSGRGPKKIKLSISSIG